MNTEKTISIDSIKGRLAFLQEAEKLKSVLRSAHTSTGIRTGRERISQSNTDTPTEHCLQYACDHQSQKLIEALTSFSQH